MALWIAAVSAADLLTEGLDFVGIPGKLLLSKAGCKRAIVNRKLLHKKKLAIGYLLALPGITHQACFEVSPEKPLISRLTLRSAFNRLPSE